MRATPLLLVISRRSLVNRGGLTLSRVQEFNDGRKAKDFLFNKKRKTKRWNGTFLSFAWLLMSPCQVLGHFFIHFKVHVCLLFDRHIQWLIPHSEICPCSSLTPPSKSALSKDRDPRSNSIAFFWIFRHFLLMQPSYATILAGRWTLRPYTAYVYIGT